MFSVHVVYEHGADLRPFGCPYIRLLLPLRHPANAGAVSVTAGPDYAGETAQIVIVERMWAPTRVTLALAEDLVRRIRAAQARLVYSIDDNLLDLQGTAFGFPGFSHELKRVVRYFIREADLVLVSTAPLQARLAPLNPRSVVVPNALDEQLFTAPRPTPTAAAPLTLGFMGTFSHDADLMMIVQALRAGLRRHAPRVQLQLVGGAQDHAVAQAFAGLPVQVLNTHRPYEYPAFMRWMAETLRWDIALAPLEDTPFTRCKSDIKFLDYSALGFPGIYSHMPVYANTVQHLETGYLAENTVAGWEAALETLIQDAALRQRLGANARTLVWQNRLLAQRAPEWVAALRQVLD